MIEPLKSKYEEAEILGISVHTLTKKITAGQVQFTRKGGTRLVGFSDADTAANIAAGCNPVKKTTALTVKTKRRAA